MTIKEKIIRQAIKKCEQALLAIDFILDANPLSDLFRLEQQTIEKVKKMDVGNKNTIIYLENQIKKRDKLKKLFGQQRNSVILCEKKARLTLELCDLNNELYLLEQKRIGEKW